VRVIILEAPRLPFAYRIPRSLAPVHFSGLSMGWLDDSLPSGRLPSPGPLTQTAIADQTYALVVRSAKLPVAKECHQLVGPEKRTLKFTDRLTLATGSATITYFPPSGAPSSAHPFLTNANSRTVVATTGPLTIVITPVIRPAELCRN